MTREQMVDARMEKRERRRSAKEARQTERARETRRRRFQRLVSRGVAVLLFGGLVAGLGLWVFRPKPGTFIASQGNAHVTSEPVGFRYASDPPTSGPHAAGMAAWGIHARTIPKLLQIHNLEDGGVLIQYNCESCDVLVSKLADIVRRYPDKVVLAPYPGMKTRLALTAWSYIETFDEYDEPRILQFIEMHRGIDHHQRGG